MLELNYTMVLDELEDCTNRAIMVPVEPIESEKLIRKFVIFSQNEDAKLNPASRKIQNSTNELLSKKSMELFFANIDQIMSFTNITDRFFLRHMAIKVNTFF